MWYAFAEAENHNGICFCVYGYGTKIDRMKCRLKVAAAPATTRRKMLTSPVLLQWCVMGLGEQRKHSACTLPEMAMPEHGTALHEPALIQVVSARQTKLQKFSSA